MSGALATPLPTAETDAAPRVIGAATVAIIALLLAALLWRYAGPAWALDLGDSDNFMRLAEVRDWLGGQSWWDVRQYRVDPPGGLYTHWSRLADLPLAAGIVAFRQVTDPAAAERLALIVVPPLLLIPVLLLQRQIAVAVAGRAAAIPAVAIGASSAMLVQFVPGRVDHHGLQIMLVLAAIAGLVAARPQRGAALAAIATAMSLNVGLETAPYLALIAAFVALDWAWRGEARIARSYGIALAITVPLLFALTVPVSLWPLPKGDAIGRAHVAVAVLGGLGLAGLTALPLARAVRIAALALLGAALAALVAGVFPEVFDAPYAMVGPLLARLWMANILEMRSILDEAHDSPWLAMARVFFLAVAAAAAAAEARRRGPVQRGALLLAVVTIAGLALACWQLRAVALATAVAAPSAGIALGRLWRRRDATGSLLPFAAGLFLFSSIPAVLLGRAGGERPARPDAAAACNTPAALAAVAAAPPGLLLAPIDKGGILLALTPHTIFASAIHRDVHGNRFAYRELLAAPDDAHRGLAGSGVTYVGFCPGDLESGVLRAEAPNGLLAHLNRGQPPAWLVPIASGSSPFRFYRVIG